MQFKTRVFKQYSWQALGVGGGLLQPTARHCTTLQCITMCQQTCIHTNGQGKSEIPYLRLWSLGFGTEFSSSELVLYIFILLQDSDVVSEFVTCYLIQARVFQMIVRSVFTASCPSFGAFLALVSMLTSPSGKPCADSSQLCSLEIYTVVSFPSSRTRRLNLIRQNHHGLHQTVTQ